MVRTKVNLERFTNHVWIFRLAFGPSQGYLDLPPNNSGNVMKG